MPRIGLSGVGHFYFIQTLLFASLLLKLNLKVYWAWLTRWGRLW